jgi:transmembrane sensor
MSKPTKQVHFSKPATDQDNLIAEEAIVWFTRMQSGDVSGADKIGFQAWQSQSPAHGQAYHEVAQLWDDADFNHAIKLSNLSYTPAKNLHKRSRRFRNRLQQAWIPFGLAASLIIGVALLDPLIRFQADYSTPVGGSQTVQLSDGSNVTLNTDTAIVVAFKNNERHIHLLKGEAYFDVQPDASKPFVIDSGETETRVLGTRFIVRDTQAEDKVTVIKGLVKVSNLAQQQSVLLHPDEQVLNTHSGLGVVRHINNNRDSAWLKGRLSFQDETLEQVVNEMGRYLPGVILFSDNTLKAYRINARFDITQPKLALATLEQTLPIKITQVSDWVTVIRRR